MGRFRLPRISFESFPFRLRGRSRGLFGHTTMEVLPRSPSNAGCVVLPAIASSKTRPPAPPRIPKDDRTKEPNQKVNRACPPHPTRSKLVRQGTYSVLEPKVVKGPSTGIEQERRDKRANCFLKEEKDGPEAPPKQRKSKRKTPFVPPVIRNLHQGGGNSQKPNSFWIDL